MNEKCILHNVVNGPCWSCRVPILALSLKYVQSKMDFVFMIGRVIGVFFASNKPRPFKPLNGHGGQRLFTTVT
jgi:hypothetical protein